MLATKERMNPRLEKRKVDIDSVNLQAQINIHFHLI